MKILHLISDHQVIERALDFYDKVFPGENDILIFPDSLPLRHINKRSTYPIVTNDNYIEIAKNYDFTDVKYIVAHYMSLEKIDFIKLVPNNIHLCWEIYGGDFYNQFLVYKGFDLYYSNPDYYKKYRIIRLLFPNLFNYALRLKGQKYTFGYERRKLFKYISERTDSLGVCSLGDKRLMELYSGKQFPYVEVFNFSLKETLGGLLNSDFSKGNKILVGNSASISNNHLYALKFLRALNPQNRIILPLSYGNPVRYRDAVVSKYSHLFKDQVCFIRDYMPLSEYNEMFNSIGIMIMASWRQESWGNIVNGLYLGIKIYMSKKNSFYQWLREDVGFCIYAIEDATQEDFSRSLSLEQKRHNRELIIKRYNDSVIESNYKNHFVF